MKRKILLWIMLFAVLFTCLPVNSVSAKTSKTKAEAFSYLNGLVGQTVGSGECVALISAYYKYLGFSPVSGNGCDYATNAIPSGSGWTREKGGVPRPGDILVYTGGYGHVAICESTNVAWHQNWNGRYVEKVTRNYSAGYTYGGQYVSYWGCIHVAFADSGNNPTAAFDSCTGGIGSINVSGWAFDKDNTGQALSIHVYIGGEAGTSGAEGHVIVADQSRPDVNKAYGCGDNHGFNSTIQTKKTGTQIVSAYAINIGSGGNTLIGKKTVNIENPSPVGAFDKCSANPGTVTVRGWAYDPNDKSAQIDVHVYVGGPTGSAGAEAVAIKADKLRTDVNAAHGVGDYHGYEETITVSKTGSQPVYVYGINVGNGDNALIGSKTVNIPQDTEPPQLTNPQIVNLSSSGYTVKCTVKDNAQVDKVLVPSWTPKDGQDDIIWHKATISGNEATCRINISEHNNENEIYYSDIYVYDKAGNETSYKNFGAIAIPKPPFTVTETDSTFEVHNATSDTQSATVVVADYLNGSLSDVHTQTETFAPNETKTYSHGANTRVFVWDSLMGMKPLTW